MSHAQSVSQLDNERAVLKKLGDEANEKSQISNCKLHDMVKHLIKTEAVQVDTVYTMPDGRGMIFRKERHRDRHCSSAEDEFRYYFEYVKLAK